MTQPEVEIRRAWRHVVGHDHDRYVDDLLLRYRQPHRYYHTGTHIMMVIRHVHDVAAMSARQPSVELVAAALYHDAIYDPRATNNEALSGALASEHLGEIGWDDHRCASVRTLIEATAGHTATVDDTTNHTTLDTTHTTSDTAILLDADLAILGSEAHSYQAYVTGVRAEYFFVDDDRWRAGRGRVLQDFVARPRIFATEYMYTELEHRARANIEAELAALHLSMR